MHFILWGIAGFEFTDKNESNKTFKTIGFGW
jgi:hypothetical protein